MTYTRNDLRAAMLWHFADFDETIWDLDAYLDKWVDDEDEQAMNLAVWEKYEYDPREDVAESVRALAELLNSHKS